MKNPELLSPVGDFECLKAAVQNGANSVYLGASSFNARARATNFGNEELLEAIKYAKLRNVSVHLTLNTLIKNEEFENAVNLAIDAYNLGVDAIIIQDLGLATYLLKNYPEIPLHASTQMTVHNLDGVKQLENFGFSRVVLSRELSINEIEYIRKNTKTELEVFIHGALCISYSGQCLLSSMIGGRSGNRGLCAQPCRLPYELVENNTKTIDKGYLMSPRDNCALEFLPELIKLGIDSFKIEGRMKTPYYVGVVTRIYRKYIDLALSNNPYIIKDEDKKELLQVFNRGGFSTGHLNDKSNRDLIFKEKPNNMGIYLGNVCSVNKSKGHITLNLNEDVSLGDSVSFENENTKYTISELMIKNKNIITGFSEQVVTIGRMKGNIRIGDKVYKLASKDLSNFSKQTYSDNYESRPVKLNCILHIKDDAKLSAEITSDRFPNININVVSDILPKIALNKPLGEATIQKQFNKKSNPLFVFENIEIDLDANLFLTISELNEFRRLCISQYENAILKSFGRKRRDFSVNLNISHIKKDIHSTSLLLNILNPSIDYSLLEKVDRVYIPLKFFTSKKYINSIKTISEKYHTFIYMPNIVKSNYKNILSHFMKESLEKYDISGFVISNISQIDLINSFKKDFNLANFIFIGNYTLNVFNNLTIKELTNLGIDEITISPELDIDSINSLLDTTYKTELIVYGNTPIMTSNYCPIGHSNKCYPDCKAPCNKPENKFYLKDRLGFNFRVIPDNIQTLTTIYNSKILSLKASDYNSSTYRIDILDEDINEINNIINVIKSGARLEGLQYTNGNLSRGI